VLIFPAVPPPAASDLPITIRSFSCSDTPACRKLYLEGLVGGGRIASNDTGFDIDDIDASYMKRPGNHFWIAENDRGEVVGMIGVQHHDEGTGEIRRLRVRQDSQRRGIGGKLVETALRYCQEHGYLKVTLDTFMEREPAVNLFQKYRFRHSRSRTVGGKELMYFYLDLYTGQGKKGE
jgi:ribosomal protein S18 acetylase RimI-like enzyme